MTPRGRRPSHAIHRYDTVNLGDPKASLSWRGSYQAIITLDAPSALGSRIAE